MANPDTTQQLIDRAREGDAGARESLARRYRAVVAQWAHGRLPGHARDLNETADLVQVTMMRAIDKLDLFEWERSGDFSAWLRQIFMNVLRDELRRAGRQHVSEHTPLDELVPGPDLIARELGAESAVAYVNALEQLPIELREIVILHLEFGLSHAELAEAVGAPSADAARMRLRRALSALALNLGRDCVA